MYLAHYTTRFIPEFDAECRIDDIFNDDFDITRQLDNLYDKIEEEKGHEKADEHIETLNNEYSALKSQFLAHLVELKEFMLAITEDLN